MTTELLGGSMTDGKPVAVLSGGRTHVFAIAKNGLMNHWASTNGDPWPSAPSPLPGGNLAASVPCAIALPDGSLHVFAITNGGPLTHWSSTDGNIWTHHVDSRATIPGGWNGLAVASTGGQRIDVFATTPGGIVQYSFNGTQALPQILPLPNSGSFPPRLLAAVSSEPGKLDVFAVDPATHMPLHWHMNGSWSGKQLIGVPGLHSNSGLAAVATGPGRVELFGITADNKMWSCSGNGTSFGPNPKPPPPGSWALPDGVPTAVARARKLDLFAIAKDGGLVHWRFDGKWSTPEAHFSGLAAGGVTAIGGASGIDVFGFQSGLDNGLLHWPAGVRAYGHDRWENWARNQQTNPIEGHCYPTCLEELVAIVRSAARQGKRARAVGSSWSFSDIAVTPGYVIETSGLSKLIDTVIPGALRATVQSVIKTAATPVAPTNLIHVEAGIQLEKLLKTLDERHQAPFTMGGAAGQTLAGVLSTSVHGSHFLLPPFPDFVRAIHLVGPDGRQHWIEPADWPITDPADHTKLQQALGPEVEIHHDDDWFDSVLVSVGSLGVIYSVVLEVKKEYKLRETRTELRWLDFAGTSVVPGTPGLRSQLLDGSAFVVNQDGQPEAVQAAIDPGTMATGNPQCFLTKRAAVDFGMLSTGKPSFDPMSAFCEGDNLLEFVFEAAKAAGKPAPEVIAAFLVALPAVPAVLLLVAALPVATAALAVAVTAVAATPILYALLKQAGPGAFGDVLGIVLNEHPDWVDPLVSLLTKFVQGAQVTIDRAHNVMGPENKGECLVRGLAVELAFDTAKGSHIGFIDAALEMFKREAATGHHLAGYFAIRFVGSSRAILSPQQSARTCMVEITAIRTHRSTSRLLGGLETLARGFGGIQHWGMFNPKNLRAQDVAGAYPRLNTWRQVRWALTNGGSVHTFDNDFTNRCGLSKAPIPTP